LARVLAQFRRVRNAIGSGPYVYINDGLTGGSSPNARRAKDEADPALWAALATTVERTEQALVLAAGVVVEATAPRGTFPVREPVKVEVNDTLPVTITVFNRGRTPVFLRNAGVAGIGLRSNEQGDVIIAPDSAQVLQRWAVAFASNSPWWRAKGRKQQDWFQQPVDSRDEFAQQEKLSTVVQAFVQIAGEPVTITTPVVYRFADPVKGDLQIPVSAVPGIAVNLGSSMEYMRAGVPVERMIPVRITSAYPHDAKVAVRILLPDGLKADSVERERTLGAQRCVDGGVTPDEVSEQRDCSGEDEECCDDGFDGQAGNVLLRAGLVDEERDGPCCECASPGCTETECGFAARDQHHCDAGPDEQSTVCGAHLGGSESPWDLQPDRAAHLLRPDQSEDPGEDGECCADVAHGVHVRIVSCCLRRMLSAGTRRSGLTTTSRSNCRSVPGDARSSVCCCRAGEYGDR
jgi:hypothetical protein